MYRNLRRTIGIFLIVVVVAGGLAGCGKKDGQAVVWDDKTKTSIEAFSKAVDQEYAYDIALELSENPLYHSSSLGTRTAGSEAEHKAADFIVEKMKEIGLEDVEKVGVKVDKWQFNDATLKVDGLEAAIKPHSYATASTPKNGVRAEVVFMGTGTAKEYEGVDVTGKIVLIDIDQRANWWITYPMLEAQLHGAVAIISANTGGFAQVNKDALNCQDICGPTAIPCVSISVNDSEKIKAKIGEGPLMATLSVDNVVEPGGTSYNIVGKLKGSQKNGEMIAVGAHYDTYFKGFQDDSCAVGLALAMAKAMKDSQYTPEKDIVFVIHGAEEWGASNTQFDWTTGAWRMINEAHPEWVGKIQTFINFELPAYEYADYTSAYSAPELYTAISTFVNDSPFAPKPEKCFKEGFLTEGYQTYTYSDDFSYYAAGVPSTVNGFLLDKGMEDVFPFYIERYHSQFDDKTTYNPAVMDFNIKFYGAFAIFTDRNPALLLDFGAQCDRLDAAVNKEIDGDAGADIKGYSEAVEKMRAAAKARYEAAVKLNAEYARLSNENKEEKMADIVKEAAKLNNENLQIFKYVQDQLLGLMYEKPVVPHQAPAENIALINGVLEALEAGKLGDAVDEYGWEINNVFEWYTMYFSPEVIKLTEDTFFSEANKDNLFWGTGKMAPIADVKEATRLLMKNYDAETPDPQEIKRAQAVYEKALGVEKGRLKELMTKETAEINKITEMLTQ